MNCDISVARDDFKFQPASAGQSHLGGETQSSWRIAYFYVPTVERVARLKMRRVASATIHARTAKGLVNPTANRPEPIKRIPSMFSTDALNRGTLAQSARSRSYLAIWRNECH